MRCRHVDRLVTAYVDGELDERRSRALRGHLRTCAACAARVEDEAALRRAASELASPMDPPSDMWQSIEARLADSEVAESQRSPAVLFVLGWVDQLRPRALPLAVMVTAVVLAAVWLGRSPGQLMFYRSLPGRAPRARLAAPVDTRTVDEAYDDEVAAAELRYQAALADLRGEVAELSAELSPDQRASLSQALADADRTIAAARAALPGGGIAAVHAAYRSEIDLLTRAATGQLDALALADEGER